MIKNPTLVIEFGGEGKGGKSSKKLRTFGRKIVRGGGKKEWKKKIANRSSFSLSFSSESVQQPVPEGFLRRQERVVKLLRLNIYTHTHTHTRSEGLATSRGDDAAVSTFRFRGCIFNWQSRAGSQRSTGTDKISLSLTLNTSLIESRRALNRSIKGITCNADYRMNSKRPIPGMIISGKRFFHCVQKSLKSVQRTYQLVFCHKKIETFPFSSSFLRFHGKIYNINISPSRENNRFYVFISALSWKLAGLNLMKGLDDRFSPAFRIPWSCVSRRSFVSIARLSLIIVPRDGSIRIVARG